jgi:hypothetical protein
VGQSFGRRRLRAFGALAAASATVSALLVAAPWSATAQTVEVPCSASSLVSDLLSAYDAHGVTETLSLSPSCTYAIPAPATTTPAPYYGTDGTPFDWYGPSGLPAIDGTITIEGNGATIERSGSARYRLFYVAADATSPSTLGYTTPGAGSLTLRDVTLTDGLAHGGDASANGGGAGMGGAIFDQGTLVLDRVTLTQNTAQGGQGLYDGSTVTGGGGIGTNGTWESTHNVSSGGGFGPGAFGGASGGAGSAVGFSGGGGGFVSSENGHDATMSGPGAGGGQNTGLGGAAPDDGIEHGGAAGDGSGGGAAQNFITLGLAGSSFGEGGAGQAGESGGGGAGVGGGASGAGGLFDGGAGFGGGGGGPSNSHSGGFGGGGGGFGGGEPGSANSHIEGGGGAGMGGAVFVMQGKATIQNSTLVANQALGGAARATATPGQGLGGAIFNLSGSVSLVGDTITGNTAAQGGGGIYNLVYDSVTNRTGSVTLSDTIVYGNGTDVTSNKPASTTAGANLGTATIAATAPDIVGSSDVVGAGTITGSPSSANPKLGALAGNGGPGMQTELPGAGSPALGAGTNCPSTDERGEFRPHDGCDLGAVEITPTGRPTATITTPANGATYTAGAKVDANYSCSDPAGPGIASCTAPVADGHPIDTATPGKFTFTVTATSADGASTVVSSSYTVTKPPPPPPQTVSITTSAAVVRHRRASIELACAGGAPGSTCKGKLSLTIRRRVVRVVRHHRKVRHVTVVIASGRYAVATGHTGSLSLTLTRSGMRLLENASGHRLRTLARATLTSGKPTSRQIEIRLPAKR